MNVIPISEKEGPAPPKDQATSPLLNDARNLMVDRLYDALKTMLDKVDDALFEMAEKSENNALQTVYFDSMREVRLKRSRIETEFKGRFVAAFERCREGHAMPRNIGGHDVNGLKLSLVDDEQMEEDIAVGSMSDKITQGCRDELYGLNKRIGLLLGIAQLETADNPLGPTTICGAIQEAVASIEAGVNIRLIILKLFDRYVASEVDVIYQAINGFLIGKGVLSEIRTSVKRASGGLRNAHQAVAPAAEAGAAAAPEGLLGLLQQLIGAANGGATAAGGSIAPAAAWAATAPVVMSSLTQLQQSGLGCGATSGSPEPVAGSNMAPPNVLREIRSLGLVPTLDQAGDMTLDIVAMLFDYILDDKNLPDPVRMLIGRLQIPVLKVALLDKEFFSRKSHPARRLLNGMAEQAVEWAGDPGLENRFHQIAERIVQRILDEFEEDTGIFKALVRDFEKSLEDAKRDAKIRAERTVRVVQGQAKVEQAKLFVRETMDARLQQLERNEVVRNFLLTHWKHLMITDFVQGGEAGESLRDDIATMDDLVWSVSPKLDAGERNKLNALLPRLLSRLKAGMEAVSMPPIARTGFLNKLAKCHTEAIRGEVTSPESEPVRAERPAPPAVALQSLANDPAPSAKMGTVAAAPTATEAEPPAVSIPVSTPPVAQADALSPPPSDRLESTLPPDLTERTIPEVMPQAAAEPPCAGSSEDVLPPLDLEMTADATSPEFDPNQRLSFDAASLSAPASPELHPAGAGPGLAEALRERLLYDSEVRLADVLPKSPDGDALPAPVVEEKTVTMNADSLFELFISGDKSAEELAHLAELGDIEIEELTLEEAVMEGPVEIDDKHLEMVKGLQVGTWLEFRGLDGTVTRAKLTWVNTSTEVYMFTDRAGQKLGDRTRNGLVAEFRRGSAWLARDIPLLDRAFTRLLDGLSGHQRAEG